MTRHPALSNIELPVARQVPDVLAGSDAGRFGTAPRKLGVRRVAFAAAAAVLLAGGVWYGWNYWTFGQYLVSTDDAYVKTDSTTMAPKVSGYHHEVLVGDNDLVKAGQILAQIDDRDFKVALDQTDADVAAAQSAIASKRAQLENQEAASVRNGQRVEIAVGMNSGGSCHVRSGNADFKFRASDLWQRI